MADTTHPEALATVTLTTSASTDPDAPVLSRSWGVCPNQEAVFAAAMTSLFGAPFESLTTVGEVLVDAGITFGGEEESCV
jgi:hypothetical protein